MHNCTAAVKDNRSAGGVDGSWARWSAWSKCGAGAAISMRTRNCTDPAPSKEGVMCLGSKEERRECPDPREICNATWSGWTEWSECKQAADPQNYIREATRFCSVFGGNCGGDAVRRTQACSPRGEVWADWTLCVCQYKKKFRYTTNLDSSSKSTCVQNKSATGKRRSVIAFFG